MNSYLIKFHLISGGIKFILEKLIKKIELDIKVVFFKFISFYFSLPD